MIVVLAKTGPATSLLDTRRGERFHISDVTMAVLASQGVRPTLDIVPGNFRRAVRAILRSTPCAR
jgi:hypothetical protein